MPTPALNAIKLRRRIFCTTSSIMCQGSREFRPEPDGLANTRMIFSAERPCSASPKRNFGRLPLANVASVCIEVGCAFVTTEPLRSIGLVHVELKYLWQG